MFKKIFFLLSVSVLLFSSYSEAREWTILGPRALGMGGASVAVANDATASYWNPAAYGFFKSETKDDYGKRKWSTALDAGVGAQLHEDIGEEINKISKFDFDTLDNGQISANKVMDFLQLVNELKTFNENKNRAATVDVNAGLRIQVGHWGLGGYVFGELSGKGELDLINISPVSTTTTFTVDDFTNPANYGCSPCTSDTDANGLTASDKSDIDAYLAGLGWTATQRTNFINSVDNGLEQAQTAGITIPSDIADQTKNVASLANTAVGAGGTFTNNDSKLIFKGLAVAEVPLTYGHAITNNFAVGGNIKYMKGRTYNTSVKIFNTDFGDAMDKAKKDYTDSQNFGLDIGLLYRLGDSFRVGMVGKNLNSPEFDMKHRVSGDDDNIKEAPQVRAGIAYKPLSFVIMAADIDLTKNETTIGSDYKSQNFGGGLEINIFKILQLRGGAYKNISENDIGLVYTAGLGLNLWIVNLDVGASMASEKVEVDNNDDIPKEAKVELALSMLF